MPNSAQPSLIDPDFALRTVAIGTDPLENPSGVITKFGQLASGVNTEPDEESRSRSSLRIRRADAGVQLWPQLSLPRARERRKPCLCDAHQSRRDRSGTPHHIADASQSDDWLDRLQPDRWLDLEIPSPRRCCSPRRTPLSAASSRLPPTGRRRSRRSTSSSAAPPMRAFTPTTRA